MIGSGSNGKLVFGEYTLDIARRELLRAGASVKLEPLAFDLLAYLVRHRDRVVGKEELLRELWNGRVVSDASVTTRINAVRHAVGDDGKAQRLIRTFSRKGVRFVGTIEEALAPLKGTPPLPAGDVSGAATAYVAAERAVVAVGTFFILGGDAGLRPFADGLAEECALALGRFQWFSVLGPMPADLAPEFAVSPARAARAVGAHYLVQGAIRRDSLRLRVTVRLIDAATGTQLWSDRFDDDASDHFASQERMAILLAGGMETPLRGAEARRRNAAPTCDATPYDLHLRAHPIFSDGKQSVMRSLCLLEQAIALDADYAPALADAANCLQILDINCDGLDRQKNREKALHYARRALRASNEPGPTTTAAFALTYFNEDSETAIAVINHELTVNPSFARGWYMSGMANLYAGQPEAAIDAFENSMRLDPHDRLGRRNNAGVGIAYLFCHRFDDAIPRLSMMVREFPRWATPYAALASCHAHLGYVADAEAVTRRLKSIDPSLRPNALQFRNPSHQDLLAPGIRFAS